MFQLDNVTMECLPNLQFGDYLKTKIKRKSKKRPKSHKRYEKVKEIIHLTSISPSEKSPISNSSSPNRYGNGPSVATACPISTTLTMASQTSDRTSLYLGDIGNSIITSISINSSTTITTIGTSRRIRAMWPTRPPRINRQRRETRLTSIGGRIKELGSSNNRKWLRDLAVSLSSFAHSITQPFPTV